MDELQETHAHSRVVDSAENRALSCGCVIGRIYTPSLDAWGKTLYDSNGVVPGRFQTVWVGMGVTCTNPEHAIHSTPPEA